jgi:hypothetical protein
MTNTKGQRFDFIIRAGNALVDNRGVIRAFSVEYDDGYIGNYKLLPKHSRVQDISLWIAEFLGGYGLARLGGKIIKGEEQVHHMARYTAGYGSSHVMRSFIEHHFMPKDLGYFNLQTEELVFPNGELRAPAGAW